MAGWAQLVDRLSVLAGIEPFYFDIQGNRHETTLESRVLVLGGLGLDVSSLQAAGESVRKLEEACWRQCLAPFIVQRPAPDGFEIDLFLPAEQAPRTFGWETGFESGERAQGSFRPNDLSLLGSRQIDGRLIEHRRLRIEARAPIGYHHLRIMADAAAEATLAITPERCYLPDDGQDRRFWGLSTQFYTLKSDRDWGIGDFSDLARLTRMTGEAGGSAVAINPLHTLFADKPDAASPYSPSSRLFLNPLYIDVESAGSGPNGPEGLRAARMIDYPKVWAAKRRAFEQLFAAMRSAPDNRAAADFARFVERGGKALQLFAAFCALEETYGDGGKIPWPQWPKALATDAAALAAFERERAERILFHQYLQYLADGQLAHAADEAKACGMEIGIIRDLALGANPDGADAWMLREHFAGTLRCGAPPDAFNPHGQEWGVLPLDPLKLRADFQPYIAMLRANMRHAGGLRIDHVIGLQRQYLVPLGGQGCYVRFPMDSLFKLLALESHRNACLVIGEDLGTVPEGLRDRMQEANILGTSLFYFERCKDGSFTAPYHYRKKAAASISTHDLPTLRGWWEGEDIGLRENIGMCDSAQSERAREERERDRRTLVSALAAANVLQEAGEASGAEEASRIRDAAHAFLASSSAMLFLAQLDDLSNEKEQLNLPGTVDQYPNWRRKLSLSLDDPAFADAIRKLAQICRGQARGREMGG